MGKMTKRQQMRKMAESRRKTPKRSHKKLIGPRLPTKAELHLLGLSEPSSTSYVQPSMPSTEHSATEQHGPSEHLVQALVDYNRSIADHDYDIVRSTEPSVAEPPRPASSNFISTCPHFTYEYEHFDRIPTAQNGSCLFEALSHFIRSPSSLTVSEIRQTIANFYASCKERELITYLGGVSPVTYAVRKQIRLSNTYGDEMEILVAATLFQRNIYVFRRKFENQREHYDISEFTPLFGTEKKWQVFGVPEFPIVLACSQDDDDQLHFDAMLLRSIASILSKKFDEEYNNVSPRRKRSRYSGIADGTAQQRSTREKALELENQRLREELQPIRDENAMLKSTVELLRNEVRRIRRKWEDQCQKYIDMKKQCAASETRERIRQTRTNLNYECIPIAPHIMKIRPVNGQRQFKHYHHVVKTNVKLSDCTARTIQTRLGHFDRILTELIGSDTQNEKAFSIARYLKTNRSVLDAMEKYDLKYFKYRLTPAQSVSIYLDLNMSKTQYRRLSQLLSSFNANPFASERQFYKEIRTLSSNIQYREDLISLREMKDGRESFVDRWCVRAPSLIPYIREMYARTLKYNALRSDANFGDRIWLAIGGDKGGDSTKIVISFGNVQKTGSFNNLHILAMYQGDESEVNLRRALEIYEKEWKELKSLMLTAQNQLHGSDEANGLPKPSNDNVASAETVLPGADMDGSYDELSPSALSNGPTTASTSQQINDISASIDHTRAVCSEPIESWPIRVMLFGDLLFLSRMMGLSGSSSTYPCIFCTVKQEQLRKMNSSMHEFSAPPRQLSDWDSVGQFGIRSKPLIPVEICDIVPPTLHIMLGIGTDLVNRIEEACHRRDLSLGADVNATKEYKRLSKLTLEKESELKGATTRCGQIKAILDHVVKDMDRSVLETPRKRRAKSASCAAPICLGSFFEEATLTECSKCGEKHHLQCNQKIVFQDGDLLVVNEETANWTCGACAVQSRTKEDIHVEISALFDELEVEKNRLSSEMDEMKRRLIAVYDVIKSKTGSATNAFDKALDILKVDRKIFLGGVLNGNHIRKIIKGDGPRILTSVLDGDNSTERVLLQQLLETLGAVTDLMCASRFLTDDETDRLTSDCREFGELYAKLEGDEFSITPKLHILLHHVPEFVRRNKTVGLISEHGLESIHCRFNKLGRRFACVRSPSKRMTSIVKQHEAESTTLARMRHHRIFQPRIAGGSSLFA